MAGGVLRQRRRVCWLGRCRGAPRRSRGAGTIRRRFAPPPAGPSHRRPGSAPGRPSSAGTVYTSAVRRGGRQGLPSCGGPAWAPWPRWPGRGRGGGSRAASALTDGRPHHYSTAREMAAAVAAKEISARELLDLHLKRIEETNPAVNAVVSLDEERARAQAPRRPTRRLAARRAGRGAARAAVRVQGHPRGRRLADHVRVAAARGLRAAARRADRRADPGARASW